MSDFSWQDKYLAITPKPFASMSILGSLYIIKHVLSKPERRGAVFHRILLGLSIYDLVSSIAMFLGSWPIPRGSPGVYLAGGNDATCSAQGFFVQLTVGTPLYNASLATYYFLVVHLGWKEYQLREVEWALHWLPNAFALVTAIAAAATGSYGNSKIWCWIVSSKDAFRLGFFYIPIWVSIVWTTVAMAVMYGGVAAQERKMRQYAQPRPAAASQPSTNAAADASGTSRRQVPAARTASQKMASQGLFYVLTFFLAWIFPSWTRIHQMIHGSIPFPVMALMAIFSPWQGWVLFVIFSVAVT